jgi:hypothetical protein
MIGFQVQPKTIKKYSVVDDKLIFDSFWLNSKPIIYHSIFFDSFWLNLKPYHLPHSIFLIVFG